MGTPSDRRKGLWDAVRGVRISMVGPWVLSAVVHGSLVALAFVVVWTVTTERAPLGPPAVVSFYDPAPAPMAAQDRQTSVERRDERDERAERTEVAAVAPIDVPSPEELLAETVREVEREPVSERDAAAPDLSDEMFERRFPEVEVYGMGSGDAQRIVYVVDGSGSMLSTFPMLKRELARSIKALGPTQWFQVIFFQGFDEATGTARAVAAPDPRDPKRTNETRLIQAKRANVRDVLAWVETVRAGGRSDPLPALQIGAALEPDAIFLVSNSITGVGEWQRVDDILSRLETLNPRDRRSGNRPITIKVIGLPPEDESGLLQRIGALHGGEDGYKLIERHDLGGRE